MTLIQTSKPSIYLYTQYKFIYPVYIYFPHVSHVYPVFTPTIQLISFIQAYASTYLFFIFFFISSSSNSTISYRLIYCLN